MIYVQLTPNEYIMAAHVGFMRQTSNICRGRNDAYGYTGIGYDIHILGCLGEYVVAKYLNTFWNGISALGVKDVGKNIQVRTTAKKDNRLIVHPDDADNDCFILVSSDGLRFGIHGYIYGVDAKRKEWWQSPQKGRPAYFVPQSALMDIHTLDYHAINNERYCTIS